jgi:leader peptidase (prepilin peptidase)/N-methyltransferase
LFAISAFSEAQLWAVLSAPVCGAAATVQGRRARMLANAHDDTPAPWTGAWAGITAGVALALLLVAATSPSWPQACAYTVFFAGLAYLSVVDLRFLAVPVDATLGLIVAGLAWRLVSAGFAAVSMAALAALAVYLLFQALNRAYLATRGKSGLGAGDALIAAAIGAWLAPEQLAWSVALGSVATLAWVVLLRGSKLDRSQPFPLAPGLAVGALVVVVFGRGPW